MARNSKSRPTLMLLVRHGHTPTTGRVLPGRMPGLDLSDQGRAQADEAAQRIASLKGVAAVYASPLDRARQTAAPIARALGLRVRAERGLLEADMGEWTGGELKALRRRSEWKTVQQYPSGFRFPGGESFIEMQLRITTTLDRLVHRHPGETVVAVSHADPIRTAVAHALGTHLDLFQRIAISPCSITAIGYGATGPLVLSVNSTGKLNALGPS